MKLCALALAGSAVAFAAPMLTLDPKSGPPTSYTVVAGTGFTGGETVDIYFDTTEVATATVRSTGEFSGVDPELATLAVLGMSNWTYQWLRPGGRYAADQITEVFYALVIHGLSAS